MIVVADLHHRGHLASAEAFDGRKREQPVRGRAALLDPQHRLQMPQQVLGSAQHAGDVVAELQVEHTHRLGMEEGVEGRQLVDPDPLDTEDVGDLFQHRAGQMAMFLLRDQKRGHDRRALVGIPRRRRLDLFAHVHRVQIPCYLSTSAITGSRLPSTAIMSAR